jgi:hypothetical protein
MAKRNPEIDIPDDTPEGIRDFLAWLSQVPAGTMAAALRWLDEKYAGDPAFPYAEYARQFEDLADQFEDLVEREQKRRERAAEYTELGRRLDAER